MRRKLRKKTLLKALTVDIQFVALLSAARHTRYPASVVAAVRGLHPGDPQVVSPLHVLCLPAGQDGLPIAVPGDGRGRHSASLTLQSHHSVQQGCGLCGDVATLDGGWNWREDDWNNHN